MKGFNLQSKHNQKAHKALHTTISDALPYHSLKAASDIHGPFSSFTEGVHRSA